MESAFLLWNTKKTFWTVVLFIFIIFIYQWISSPMILTINGVGEASAPAERATLTFSVIATGDNSAVALANVKSKADKIREVLKSNAVLEDNIYESQASVYPSSATVAGASGYTSSISMGFKTTDILRLDVLTSEIYTQGASVVTQPVLSAKDNNTLNAQAFQLALKDANNQANKIALRNLKVIKKVVLVQENNAQSGSVTSKGEGVSGSGDLKVSKILSVSYKMW